MAKSPIIYNGKKEGLLKYIAPLYPNTIANYYEPFLGGGSIFFHLHDQNIINGKYYLSDLNSRLIRIYEEIRDNLNPLLNALSSFTSIAVNDLEGFYYALREIEDITSTKSNLNLLSSFTINSRTELVAKDIFLNRMSKNGWRTNKQNKFNLPFYTHRLLTPTFFYQPDTLINCSKVFNDPNVDIKCQDYLAIEAQLQAGDFVYLDPPYEPASSTANFTQYICNGFGRQEQIELSKFLQRIDAKGVKFVLSNSLAAKELYTNSNFTIKSISTKDYKNSSGKERFEILVSN